MGVEADKASNARSVQILTPCIQIPVTSHILATDNFAHTEAGSLYKMLTVSSTSNRRFVVLTSLWVGCLRVHDIFPACLDSIWRLPQMKGALKARLSIQSPSALLLSRSLFFLCGCFHEHASQIVLELMIVSLSPY